MEEKTKKRSGIWEIWKYCKQNKKNLQDGARMGFEKGLWESKDVRH